MNFNIADIKKKPYIEISKECAERYFAEIRPTELSSSSLWYSSRYLETKSYIIYPLKYTDTMDGMSVYKSKLLCMDKSNFFLKTIAEFDGHGAGTMFYERKIVSYQDSVLYVIDGRLYFLDLDEFEPKVLFKFDDDEEGQKTDINNLKLYNNVLIFGGMGNGLNVLYLGLESKAIRNISDYEAEINGADFPPEYFAFDNCIYYAANELVNGDEKTFKGIANVKFGYVLKRCNIYTGEITSVSERFHTRTLLASTSSIENHGIYEDNKGQKCYYAVVSELKGFKEKGVYVYTCKIDPVGEKSSVKKEDLKIKDIVDLNIIGCKNGFIYMDKKDNCALRYKDLASNENNIIKRDYGYPAEGIKGSVFHKRDLPFGYTKLGEWIWLRSYGSKNGYEIVEF